LTNLAEHGTIWSVDEYLTTDEVAKIRRMERESLEQERFRGAGPPYISNGKRVLYPKSMLEKWLRDQLVVPAVRSPRRRAS
jgi:helix-turn-helix protein